MSEKSPKPQYEFTEQDLQERKTAKKWLHDATKEYASRSAEVAAKLKSGSSSHVGHTAIAPSILLAPAHIKAGTQMDQEIWKAENAVEDDYDDYEDYPPTREEMVLEDQQDDLERIVHGYSDDSAAGALETINSGVWDDGQNWAQLELDELRKFTTPFAQLEANREKVIAEQGFDPLQDQMKERFGL